MSTRQGAPIRTCAHETVVVRTMPDYHGGNRGGGHRQVGPRGEKRIRTTTCAVRPRPRDERQRPERRQRRFYGEHCAKPPRWQQRVS